jgi:hypothetical protein
VIVVATFHDFGAGTITLSGTGILVAVSTAGTAVARVPINTSTVARPEYPHDQAQVIYILQPTNTVYAASGSHTLLTPLDACVFVLAVGLLLANGGAALRVAAASLRNVYITPHRDACRRLSEHPPRTRSTTRRRNSGAYDLGTTDPLS